MSVWTEQEANEAVQAIIKKATIDSNFRNLCLSNPVEAVKQETGKELPDGFTLQMVESRGTNLTIVLPDLKATSELSDDDLEQVAGGGKCGAGTCGVSDACGISKLF